MTFLATLCLLLYLILLFVWYGKHVICQPAACGYRVSPKRPPHAHNRRKPVWIREKLIALSVHYPAWSHRTLANWFNQHWASIDGTVGYTFVHGLLLEHHYHILNLRREMKRRKPLPYRLNEIWAADLTGKGDGAGHIQMILGIIDHGSRLCLCLQAVPNKCVWTLLGHLCLAIGKYGKPKAIRTDCEAIWRSKRFQWALQQMRIKHKPTQPYSPWQNGRIERFFGTLKYSLDQWAVENRQQLRLALAQFVTWYNHRPHQNLAGWTPQQAWDKTDPYQAPPKTNEPINAWDGLLQGMRMQR